MSNRPNSTDDFPSAREVTKTGAKFVLSGFALYLLIAVLALVAVGGFFVLRVVTSDEVGKGEAIINKNDAVNRVNAQQRFEDLYAEIVAADKRIDVAAAAYKRDPSTVNSTNLTGAVQYCISVVADYNAEARSYNSADFRAADLPEQISDLDPTTDCADPSLDENSSKRDNKN